jgi:NADH dehydrogenase
MHKQKLHGPHPLTDGAAPNAKDGHRAEVYPPTAQVAYRQARVAAANIAADVQGNSHQQFDFTYIGDLVSLGRLSGVADPFGFKLRGLSAWLMWKFDYLLSLVGWQNRLRVALNWLLALLFPANSTLSHECSQECDVELTTISSDQSVTSTQPDPTKSRSSCH